MAPILVIGKNGTLGSEFIRLYGSESKGVDYKELDITDENAVNMTLTNLRPEVIINCAAYNAVDKAEQEQDTANNINGYALGYIGKVAKEIGALVVHYSTNYVFDGKDEAGYKEDDEPNPQSVYARSKLLGETELAANADRYYIIRTAWLYGKPGPSSSSKKSFTDTMIELAGTNPQEKQLIQCAVDQFGQPTWTEDLAKATKELIDSGQTSGIYHRTNAGSASWYDWAKQIFALKNLEVDLKANSYMDFAKPGAADRPQYGLLQTTKLPPMRFWEEALKDYLNS